MATLEKKFVIELDEEEAVSLHTILDKLSHKQKIDMGISTRVCESLTELLDQLPFQESN